MIFYRTPSGAWAGTQAEARDLCRDERAHPSAWREVDVPTSKAELLAWLRSSAELGGVATAPTPVPPAPREPTGMSAGEVLSRMDNPGVDVDAIVETIGASRGYALQRYAGAVAVAFQGLAR